MEERENIEATSHLNNDLFKEGGKRNGRIKVG